jgi:hypothetical protein
MHDVNRSRGFPRHRAGGLVPGSLLAWLLGSVPLPSAAHHSFAMFDMQQERTLVGTVNDFQWTSPHSWLDVWVQEASGRQVQWSIEMGAPGSLYQHGWRQQSVKPGDRITLVVHPLRDGRTGGSLVSATLASGKHLEEAARAPAVPPQAPAPASP